MNARSRTRQMNGGSRNHTAVSASNSNGSSSNQSSRPATNAWSRPLQQNRTREQNANRGSNSGTSQSQMAPPSGKTNSNEKSKASNPSHTLPGEHEDILRDKFLELLHTFNGKQVTVVLTSGDLFEGIFHVFTPFKEGANKNKFVFKSCKYLKPAPQQNTELKTIILRREEVSAVTAKDILIQKDQSKSRNDCNNTLMTDSDISQGSNVFSNGTNGKKKLEQNGDLVIAGSAWTSGSLEPPSSSVGGKNDNHKGGRAGSSLSQMAKRLNDKTVGGLKGSIGQWDQFSENQKLFNVTASFDEDVYTTPLDKRALDSKQIELAEKMAKEIEGTVSANIHVAEERGQRVQGDFDEEDLYSGVLRKKGQNENSSNSKAWSRKGISMEPEKKKNQQEVSSHESVPVTKKNYASVAATPLMKTNGGTKTNSPSHSKTMNIDNSEPDVVKIDSDDGKGSKTNKSQKDTNDTKETHNDDSNDVENSAAEPLPSTNVENKGDAQTLIAETEGKPEISKDKDAKKVSLTAESVESTDIDVKKDPKKKVESKLNANAKSFTFNPSAASFTPSSTSGVLQQQAATGPQIVEDVHVGGMMSQMQYPHQYFTHYQIQSGMMPLISGHVPSAGIPFSTSGPYTAFQGQQNSISQMGGQNAPQMGQDSVQQFDNSVSNASNAESTSEAHPQAASNSSNVQHITYSAVPGYYPSRQQSPMMHRATPQMIPGYPSPQMPQQYPIPGGTGASQYRTAMYQHQIGQFGPPPGGHMSQQMSYNHPHNMNTGNAAAQHNMHSYHPSYNVMGGVVGNNNGMVEDGEHVYRGGRGGGGHNNNRGGGGRGKRNGRKNGRGGNGGRGNYHNSGNYIGHSHQQNEVTSRNEERIKDEKEKQMEGNKNENPCVVAS